jgi:zinc/manganese transport system substrate-binding protein
MRRVFRTATALTGAAALTLGLAACSSDSDDNAADNGDIHIVASTAIWGSVAQRVIDDAKNDGSDLDVSVDTILSGTDDDPHEYEATAQDISKIRDADVVVGNGAGYDNWLTDNASDGAEVITADQVTEGHDHDHGDSDGGDDHADEHADDHADDHGEAGEANPHVWFNLMLVEHFADHLAQYLHSKDDSFPDRATGVSDDLGKVTDRLKKLPDANAVLTEPVAADLLDGTKVRDVTPEGYAHAALDESEPSAADISAARDLITDGKATILITNAQSQSPAASQLSQAAKDKGLDKDNGVINVNETPDNGQTYFDYLDNTVSSLEKATGEATAE